MFNAIAGFFFRLFAWLGRVLGWLGDLIKQFYGYIVIIVGVLLTFAENVLRFIAETLIWMMDVVIQLISTVSSLSRGGSMPGVEYFTLANTLLPLTEVCVMVTLYFSTYLLSLVIRVVKSWIPTVN